MPGTYDGQDGRHIITTARERIQRLGSELAVLADQTEYPVDHRARLRRERTLAIRLERDAAFAALAEWAKTAAADARRRLASNEVASAAEESRRVAMEIRISRLVDSARAGAVERERAAQLARQANAAYAVGDLDDAETLARASMELGDEPLAGQVVGLVRYDRRAADPAKARAMADLGDVEVVRMAAARDVNAAYAAALQKSMRAATAIGETGNDVASDMTAASVDSKMAAWVGAQRFGRPDAPSNGEYKLGVYSEPDGVLPGGPLDIDTRGPKQPEGAKLSGMTVDR